MAAQCLGHLTRAHQCHARQKSPMPSGTFVIFFNKSHCTLSPQQEIYEEHEKGHFKVIYNFQVSFEDEDVAHLQDPDTGEINKVTTEVELSNDNDGEECILRKLLRTENIKSIFSVKDQYFCLGRIRFGSNLDNTTTKQVSQRDITLTYNNTH